MMNLNLEWHDVVDLIGVVQKKLVRYSDKTKIIATVDPRLSSWHKWIFWLMQHALVQCRP